MEHLFGVVLGLILAVASSAHDSCTCATNKWAVCAQDSPGNCTCRLAGSDHPVDCSTLTSKCFLMKAEMIPLKEKRFWRPPHGLSDSDGVYNPDCEDSGVFKARQCNQSSTCWCVNTAGVRRTEKGDRSLSCSELVRTRWIYIELTHKRSSRAFDVPDVAKALTQLFESRYKLHPKYIAAIKYDPPLIQIRLDQNKKPSQLTVSVNGDALAIEKLWIYYVDEKPPAFCMKQLAAGISAVVTVVVLTVGIGIAVLLILRWLHTRKYKKFESKEMREIKTPSLELP
ncbi:PREDICTED: tumor-associated calcium signal transducer 2 isoform X3 [Corvus brachyrhynchos]|uniref:tumor-associated calcium signal transducer 2 isoform X3 n=1 Tax=Corvus brachyrhynchos TaxID=85066 RepID=UPI00081660A8|nr:PREDICTED: tumor-associated calcium signal transducer 2 isoform X3 [Corvus brachyrhynchos]